MALGHEPDTARGRGVQHGRHEPAPRRPSQRRGRAARRRSAARCSPACGPTCPSRRCRSPRSPTACTPAPGPRPRWPTCFDRDARRRLARGRRPRPGTSIDDGPRRGAVDRSAALGRERLVQLRPPPAPPGRRWTAGVSDVAGGVDRRRARPRRPHHRLRPPLRHLQAGHAAVPRRRPAARRCCSTPSGRCSSSSPARPTRPTSPARSCSSEVATLRRRPRHPPPPRVPRGLRHLRRPHAGAGRRRVAQHPAAPATRPAARRA